MAQNDTKEEEKAPVEPVSEPQKEEPSKKAKKAPAPKKAAPKKEEEPAEVIPGRFIVKTLEGYYVNQKRYSDVKTDAKIFDDFNEAVKIKRERGGKVVKL